MSQVYPTLKESQVYPTLRRAEWLCALYSASPTYWRTRDFPNLPLYVADRAGKAIFAEEVAHPAQQIDKGSNLLLLRFARGSGAWSPLLRRGWKPELKIPLTFSFAKKAGDQPWPKSRRMRCATHGSSRVARLICRVCDQVSLRVQTRRVFIAEMWRRKGQTFSVTPASSAMRELSASAAISAARVG
jgi:hypothetical protein